MCETELPMLARVFHAWEHHLASVSTDRVVRPFEWGLDWLPVNGSRPDPPPLERLVSYSRRVMADTDAFYRPEPTGDYHFAPAAKARPGSEAGLLTFPSALTTPHPENDVVYGRYFPARPAWAAGKPRRAVVVLPQWNADAEGHIGLARLLAYFGMSALRLSLPYHDRRMPPELGRADYIVSANLGRTLEVCRQAVLDARRAIAWLAWQGYERIGILGTSLGSCLALLTAAHEPRIGAAALNHVSPYFADVVWRGLSTRHVRAGLDGHVTLDQLREVWAPINPINYFERMRPKRSLLVYARYDLSFPVDLSRFLIDEFRRRQVPHDVAVLPCGHYSTGNAPFKFMDGYVLVRFLYRNL